MTGSVPEDVRGPTYQLPFKSISRRCTIENETDQVGGNTKYSSEWGVTKSLQQFALDLLRHSRSQQILLGRVKGGQTVVGSGFRDEYLVMVHVASRSVMLAVRDAP